MPLQPSVFVPNASEDLPDPRPDDNQLVTGVIRLGDASDGDSWYDSSLGPSYGDGRRYEHCETAFMAKVPSKHKR
jgi:hypothetical protein